MLNNKKGVSAVVATVLIVMITVAAVAIIWATIIPMIKNSADEGIKCYDAQSAISIEEGSYTCKNTTEIAGTINGSAQVQIALGSNTDITGLEIQWILNGASKNHTITNVPGVNGVKTYNMNITDGAAGLGATGNVTADGDLIANTTMITDAPTDVKVAPIITVGNTETTCEPIQTVTLVNCG